MERRSVLRAIGGAIAAGLTGAWAVVTGAFLSSALRASPDDGELDVGGVAELTDGVPVRRSVVAPRRRDGWALLAKARLGTVWLVRQGGEVRALSAVCPHAGCSVAWEDDAACFRCPCHASAFNQSGAVVAGPAPRPLDRLAARVVDGRVRVRFRQFRPGVGGQEEL